MARFGSFAASNGFAVNLVVVIALAAMGAVSLTGRPRLVRYAVWFGLVFCLADWVLVQDLGILGGLGTDPNSMIGWILLFFAGYLALTPAPGEALAVPVSGAPRAHPWRERLRISTLRPRALGGTVARTSLRSVGTVENLPAGAMSAHNDLAVVIDRTGHIRDELGADPKVQVITVPITYGSSG